MQTYEKEIDEVLSPPEHLLFVRRWNVFAFKLERAKHFISVNNHQQALYYMRSVRSFRSFCCFSSSAKRH